MKKKKIVCFLFAVLMVVSLFVPAFAADGDTILEQELSGSIDFADYPANSRDEKVYLLALMEKGYTSSGFDNDAGIYVYFYNPSMKKFNETSDLNRITFANLWDNGGNPVRYYKYPVELIESAKNGLYIKGRVDVSPRKLARMYDGKRQYDVSEIELYEDGHYNAKAYRVGYSYFFSGSDDSLTCTRTSLLTIDLDVRGTSYWTGDSAKGKGYSNLVSSVYFSVPKDIEKKYGKLYSIDYETYKYYTSPIILISDSDGNDYHRLMNNRGLSPAKANIKFWIGKSITTDYGPGVRLLYDYLFWTGAVESVMIRNRLQSYSTVFNVPELVEEKVLVTSETLQRYFADYSLNFTSGKKVRDKYSADLFSSPETYIHEYITRDNFGHLDSYKDAHSWFAGMMDYGFNYIFHVEDHDETVHVQQIQAVKMTDLFQTDFCQNYYVSKDDVMGLQNYIAAKQATENIYLFHFGFDDDYYSASGEFFDKNSNQGQGTEIRGIVAPVYLDFDILTLQFADENEPVTTFGVSSSPIDIFPDVRLNQESPDAVPDIGKFLKLLMAVVFGVAIFVVVFKVVDVVKVVKSEEQRKRKSKNDIRYKKNEKK